MKCANAAVEAVESNPHLSAAEKNAQFAIRAAAPICNPPRGGVNEALLSQKIELCMYMNSILNSDRLVTIPPSRGGGGAIAGMFLNKSEPIDISPNAKNYPNPKMPMPDWMGTTPEHKSVEFGRLGSGLRARVDQLCVSIFKQRFYFKHGMFDPVRQDEKMRDLKLAESVLFRLASETRPGGISDVKS